MSSVFTWTRQTRRWCCAWTRKADSGAGPDPAVIAAELRTPETHTHDYRRHGTTTLFAALDVATGKVIGKIKRRHRSIDFISFLRHIDRVVPEALEVHLILDNYGTQQDPQGQAVVAPPPAIPLPLHADLQFLDQFGRAILCQSDGAPIATWHSPLRRSLGEGNRGYLETHNEQPKPFRWTKSADEIIESVNSVLKDINRTGH